MRACIGLAVVALLGTAAGRAVAQGGNVVPVVPECTWSIAVDCGASIHTTVVWDPVWRGIPQDQVTDPVVIPAVEFGLLGFPRTALGRSGLMVESRGFVPRDGEVAGSAALLFLHRFSSAPEAVRVGVGFREYFGRSAIGFAERELVGSLAFPMISEHPKEQGTGVRLDAAHMLNRGRDATYARVAAVLSIFPRVRLDRLGLPGGVTLLGEGGVAASDLGSADADNHSFGYHGADLRLMLRYDLAREGELKLRPRFTVDGGWVWPERGRGTSDAWISLGIVLER